MKQENDLESKIIDAAKELFTEKGFAETSMSDIAARVGINRPVLHYYFRTKERMFRAVFGSIIEVLLPKVHDVLRDDSLPINERISAVVDAYYSVFTKTPSLPFFVMREINRDYDFVEKMVLSLGFDAYFNGIRESIEKETREGRIKPLPLRYLFLTFYSLLTVPFTLNPICTNVLVGEGESFDDFLAEWKPYIVKTITDIMTHRELLGE